MLAVMCRSYGPPEVARVEEVDQPRPGDADILIRIVATSVNRTDCGIRQAAPPIARLIYGLRRPRRPILGTELAGVVEAVGRDVTRYAVGDRVFCFDDTGCGGHAQYAVKPEDFKMLAVIPQELDFADVAAGTEGAHYAGTTLRAAGVESGSKVLVYGASGAIGSAAVQLANQRGAEVTAVCGTDGVEAVEALGPDQVVDYQHQDFTAIGQRFDLVFDAVGKTTFGACRPLLSPNGTFIATEFGPRLQNLYLVPVTKVGRGPRVRFPIPVASASSMNLIRSCLEAGTYRPIVDRTYGLADIVDAYRYVESGRKVGNVVVNVANADH